MKKNQFYAFVNEVTISKWSTKKNGLKDIREGKDVHARIDGNCRLYCTDVRLNPFTKEPILGEDGQPKEGMRSFVIEVPLRNIHDWCDSLIRRSSAENVSLKDVVLKDNSEVYHLSVKNAVLNALERVICVTEVTDVTDKRFIAVDYDSDKKRVVPAKKENGGFYETSTIHYFASDDIGLSEEVAERAWHSNWCTQEEILERCARIMERLGRNTADQENGENGDEKQDFA